MVSCADEDFLVTLSFRYLQQRALTDKTFTYEVGIDCIISFHVFTVLVFSVKHDMNISCMLCFNCHEMDITRFLT